MVSEVARPSDYWERIFSSRSWGAYPNEELVRLMGRSFRGIPDKSRIRVLEVGCGPGPNLWFLVREGFSVAGIDCSPTAIQQAKERLAAEGLPCEQPRVELRVGSFASLPWGDGNFDVVVDVEALYANPIAGIVEAIAEIWRTLKPSGVFFGRMFGVLTTGSDSGELIEPGTRRKPVTGPCAGNEIAHFFDLPELKELFGRFSHLAVDHSLRTDDGGQVKIFEWLVRARK